MLPPASPLELLVPTSRQGLGENIGVEGIRNREDKTVQPDLWEGVRLRAGNKAARPHSQPLKGTGGRKAWATSQVLGAHGLWMRGLLLPFWVKLLPWAPV